MNIKFIATGVLSAMLASQIVFADDMQQNTTAGTAGQAVQGQAATQPATPAAPATATQAQANTMNQPAGVNTANSGMATPDATAQGATNPQQPNGAY